MNIYVDRTVLPDGLEVFVMGDDGALLKKPLFWDDDRCVYETIVAEIREAVLHTVPSST